MNIPFLTRYVRWMGVALVIGIIIVLLMRNTEPSQPQTDRSVVSSATSSPLPCIPTFEDGGGPYYKPNAPFRENLAPGETQNMKLTVQGRVLRSDCRTPIAGAVLDIWQANASGRYEEEWYRGKVRANEKGEYRFGTVIPKGYGEGTGFRPPHIHFKVLEGEQELITSQMFFPDAVGWTEEAYIVRLEKKEENGTVTLVAHHDIIVP